MREAAFRWLMRLGACTVIVGALIYIPYRVYGSDGWVRYRMMQLQDAALARDNERLARENAQLRRDNRHLRDDLGAIADVARDELGLVGAGEIVVQLPPEDARP